MIKSELLHSALRSFLRFLIIAPFNILIIAIPGLITFGLILFIWAIVIGLFSMSIATPIVAFQTELISVSFWMVTAVFSTSLFTLSSGVSLGILIFFVTKHFLIYMLGYLQWNLRFIFQKKTKA